MPAPETPAYKDSPPPTGPELLFFGFHVRTELWEFIQRHETHKHQAAAQKVSALILDGLDQAAGKPLDLLRGCNVSPWPRFPKVLLNWLPARARIGATSGKGSLGEQNSADTYASDDTPKPSSKGTPDALDACVHILNLPLLAYPSSFLSSFWQLLRWGRRCRTGGNRCVVVYAMYTPHLLATRLAARLLGLRTVLIVPDLVQFMKTEHVGRLEACLRGLNRRFCEALAHGFDGFVFFTREMAEVLEPGSRPWIVVEGCAQDEDQEEAKTGNPSTDRRSPNTPFLPDSDFKGVKESKHPAPRENKTPYFLYSGAISLRYGLEELLDAFEQMKQGDCKLVLTGSGPDVEWLRERTRANPQIRYLGMLEDRAALRQLQHKALALINPRQGDEEYTHYSFPSKNLEFMASGRPTLVCSPNGIPDDYRRYLLMTDGPGTKALTRALEGILKRPADELDELGARAREYVLREKSPTRQGERIYELVQKLFL